MAAIAEKSRVLTRLVLGWALCCALSWTGAAETVSLEIRPHESPWCATYTDAALKGTAEALFELRMTSQATVDTKFVLIERNRPAGVQTSYYLEGWDEISDDVHSADGWTSWVFSPGETALLHLRVWSPDGSGGGDVIRICALPLVGGDAGGRIGPGPVAVCEAYGYGIMAGGEVEWLGTGSTYFEATTLHANGAAKITGSNKLYGTVSSSVRLWSTGSCKINGDARAPVFKGKTPGNVTGTATKGDVPTVELPDLDLTPYHSAALANGEVYNGNQHLSGSHDISPTGGIMWVNGDLRISGSGDMYGCFIATGDIRT